MFEVVTIRDTVYIHPRAFGVGLLESVSQAISIKYAGKHVEKLGLCVALWDVAEVGEPFVTPGQGGTHVKCTFRLCIFRPVVGEVLQGIVSRSVGGKGVFVKMGDFGREIFVPQHALQEPSEYDEQEGCYMWVYDGHPLHMYKGEPCRVRVTAVSEDGHIVATTQQDGLGLNAWWAS
jgi:DNA-directed RNA polymerase subunit E'/Rpb7